MERQSTWLLFRDTWFIISHWVETGLLLADLTGRLKQCLLDTHYCRKFYTQTSHSIEFIYDLKPKTLESRLFIDEKSNREVARNTLLYGFPMKLQYYKPPLLPGKRLMDLVSKEDVTTLLETTSIKDAIMVLRTRFLPALPRQMTV